MKFCVFGEMLWDYLPAGEKHAGGAAFNVSAHLAQVGISTYLISAVGQDALGEEILQVAQTKGIKTPFVGQARVGLPTGTVRVKLDADANASYDISQPAAWDEISISKELLNVAAEAQAFVFGSLAARGSHNLQRLEDLLHVQGPWKFFDVNLRPPFDALDLIIRLGKQADVIKLNATELVRLASLIDMKQKIFDTPHNEDALAKACATLAEVTQTSCLCVTRGGQGAILWQEGTLTVTLAPPVVVKDTIGAGDAFMAGLVLGLTCRLPPDRVLDNASRLGSYVASQNGATPKLPLELVQIFLSHKAYG